jgi:flagellar hook-associated protein 1 FlgK
MSIQAALNSALSSLTLLQQQTTVISNNIANASTEGYRQQELTQTALVSNGAGGGVVAGRVRCLANQAATSAAHQAIGAQAYSRRMTDVLNLYANALGSASDSTSLAGRFSALDSALTALSVTPNDATVQTEVAQAARSLTETLSGLGTAIADARQQADQGIATAVVTVNDTLDRLARNERDRGLAVAEDRSTAVYDSERNRLLSSLAENLPVRVIHNGREGIVVTTDGGTTLWDGQVHRLSFTATPAIPTAMRADPDGSKGQIGGLSGVTVNGRALAVSESGAIAGNLHLRDATLPGFADQLDTIAAGLIGRFQAADRTVAAGSAGLFTDGGAALDTTDPAAITGLAGRIALNARVDTEGANWRMRDGVQAVTQGPAGDNTQVLGFIEALRMPVAGGAAGGLPVASSLGDAVAQISGSQQTVVGMWAERNVSRTEQANDARTALTSGTGVNIDEQLQRLLIVQQTYAASAQVIRAASSMMDTLLRAAQ